jgi:hypothetical protein
MLQKSQEENRKYSSPLVNFWEMPVYIGGGSILNVRGPR